MPQTCRCSGVCECEGVNNFGAPSQKMYYKLWYSRLGSSTRGGGWQAYKETKSCGPCVGSMLLAIVLGGGLLSLQMLFMGPDTSPWLPLSLMLGSTSSSTPPPPPPPPFYNVTGHILHEIIKNGTTPCHEQNTNATKVVGLVRDATDIISLSTNVVHRFWLESYTVNGTRRCAGGDYYETDLSSPLWKSRPQVEDLQNGTYAVQFMVPDEFAGFYNFSAVLLFDAYHGLDHNPMNWAILQQTVFLRLHFVNTPQQPVTSNQSGRQEVLDDLSNLQRCEWSDYHTSKWSGRWSRPRAYDSCPADSLGSYRHCFPEFEPCESPWCHGLPSRLESTGWSYSAHCAFHIFETEEAWECLSGRWLLFWGDSNFQDTIRNLVYFVLGVQPPSTMLRDWQLQRSFETYFMNPKRLWQGVHISSDFNGDVDMNGNGRGLDVLQDEGYRAFLRKHFEGEVYPDTIILNSGLHDGMHFPYLANYVDGVDRAVDFWDSILQNVTGKLPKMLYRTTVAPAGSSRSMPSNPCKMEVYNKIITEKMQARFPDMYFVDAFDMSFPWHFDNNNSDGGHYGRPPGSCLSPWHCAPHQYFVDIMVVHTFLNAICPRPS